MGKFALSFFIILALLIARPAVFAEGTAVQPCPTLTLPAPLKKPKDITPLGCPRPFTIHGEIYSADSPQAQDASTLRYFTQSVPSAHALLTQYQDNRESSKTGAYIGTLGLALFIFSGPLAAQFGSSKAQFRAAFRTGGIIMAASGFFFTFSYLRDNESLIPKAVQNYNQAQPQDPIELQFSTGWRF